MVVVIVINRHDGGPQENDVMEHSEETGADFRSARNAVMKLKHVSVSFDGRMAVRDVTFNVLSNRVTALIGPSGSGKTTILRALNRLHDQTRGASVSGTIILDDVDIYRSDISPVLLRRRVGMVFQRPNPFPLMSIYDNVASGLAFHGIKKKQVIDDRVEQSLRAAALWDVVKDRLKKAAVTLSGGEQQRLCIARALAVEPEVLLMDEPTSALDPLATQQIEDLMVSLKKLVTIVIVTHNMQQAYRISDDCAFLLMGADRAGELIEFDATPKIFYFPKDPRTIDYISGRFG